MLKAVINYLNLKLGLLNYFDLTRCLSELKSDSEGNIAPREYISNGEWQEVNFDEYDGVSYWRLRDEITSDRTEERKYVAGSKNNVETIVPLRLVFSIRRTKLTEDDAYSFDRIRQTLLKQFTIDDDTLVTALGAESVRVDQVGSISDPKKLWDEETESTGTFEPKYEVVFGAVDIDVVIISKHNCLPTECDDVDSDILHSFDFCLPSVQERLTQTQQDCLSDWLCGACDPVTEQINGVTIGTVASGGTNNQVIQNSAATPIGTAANPSVIPDARIGANGTYIAQTPATVDATIDVHDTSGSDVGSENSGAWEIADATVNVNSSLFDTVVAEGDLNVPVQYVNGTPVGTIVGGVVQIPNPVQSVFIKFGFESGNDETGTLTIDADNAGTFTSTTDDGSSGTITYNVNGGGFASFVNPTALGIGDTIAAKRTITTGAGYAKISGTYV